MLVALHCNRAVATHSVGRQEEHAAVTACCNHNCVCGVALNLSGDKVAHDDTACAAVYNYQVEHLAAYVALHCALVDLTVQ